LYGNDPELHTHYEIAQNIVLDVRPEIKFIILRNKRFAIMMLGVLTLLLVPLVAMQFTDAVKWTLLDFVVAAALLLATALLCELTIRKINKPRYRIAICAAILVLLFLIWAELAVGIFGTPLSGH
jgi:hypothetical protein